MTMNSDFLGEIRANTKTFISNEVTHIGVGDDGTTPTAADSALGNQTFIDAVDDTDTSQTGKAIMSLRIATTENNGDDITEVGAFDAASGGDLKSRDVITTIAKTSDIQVYIDLEYETRVTEVDSFE